MSLFEARILACWLVTANSYVYYVVQVTNTMIWAYVISQWELPAYHVIV